MLRREKQIIAACALYLITCALLFAEARADETVDSYPQWELPKDGKTLISNIT